jgi:membrane-bound lytic murein transglycosylase F
MAESNLKPEAVSWVGAEGLMQFMPKTWEWMADDPWKGAGPADPEAAIFVGCKYMKWNWDRVETDKYNRKALTNAAYNSGLGNVWKAQKVCRNSTKFFWCDETIWDFPHVEHHLVTAPRSQEETRGYVRRIRKFEKQLEEQGEF